MSADVTAVVVGGGSGIGAALVARYRAAGVPVTVWDVTGDRDITCDVTDPDAVDAAVARSVEANGVPRWLTVTAGVGHGGYLVDADPTEFDRVMAINTRGNWLVLRGLARVAIDAEVALSMVAVSSGSGSVPDRMMGIYCASKAALAMLVRVAAAEWAPHA